MTYSISTGNVGPGQPGYSAEYAGYVEMSRSGESYPYVACSVTLSASGIDLIENRLEFEKKFPNGGK